MLPFNILWTSHIESNSIGQDIYFEYKMYKMYVFNIVQYVCVCIYYLHYYIIAFASINK